MTEEKSSTPSIGDVVLFAEYENVEHEAVVTRIHFDGQLDIKLPRSGGGFREDFRVPQSPDWTARYGYWRFKE
jgi:hypothetical protein